MPGSEFEPGFRGLEASIRNHQATKYFQRPILFFLNLVSKWKFEINLGATVSVYGNFHPIPSEILLDGNGRGTTIFKGKERRMTKTNITFFVENEVLYTAFKSFPQKTPHRLN